MRTKERILNTAIDLFNETGTTAVSTNHIAQAMGISPGNLYYHFRNKEEIIRAILARLMDAWTQLYTLPQEQAPMLHDLQRMLRGTFLLMWEYRFFYREMVALMHRDPLLKERYRYVRRKGFANLDTLLRHFLAAGVLQMPEDETIFPDLSKIIWLISDFWLPFVEIAEAFDASQHVEEGIQMVMHVLRPYINESASEHIQVHKS